MSKHETTNQFKDGLIMDVHPLQTPNTVLTDCLNGTFITYNGNEHVLQNDMGNFKLEKCKLKENYIPIGTASYGDILYIASYNPVDKKFELGSYPSPLQWNSNDYDDEKSFDTIINRALSDALYADPKPEGLTNFTYSKLEEYATSVVLDAEDLKIQPGDKYQIINETEQKDAYIEGIKYFILDESNRKQYLDEIEENKDFQPVSWQIPGHLGMSSSILTPYDHKLYIMSVSTGPTSVWYKLRSVISIYDDDLLKQDSLNSFFKNLRLKVDYFVNGDKGGYKGTVEKKDTTLTFVRSDDEALKDNDGSYLKFTSFDQYQWLYDKKQLVYEFEITIDYPKYDDTIGHNYYLSRELTSTDNTKYTEYYQRPTEIRCVPVLWMAVNNSETGTDVFTIEYDNLKSSVMYTANGNDRNSAAESVFTWSDYTHDVDNNTDLITIKYDLFKQNEETKLVVFWKKLKDLFTSFNLPQLAIPTGLGQINDKQYFVTPDVDTITLVDVPTDEYIVVFFHFLNEGENFPSSTDDLKEESLIARFVYIDSTGNHTSQSGRADREVSLKDMFDDKLNECLAKDVSVRINVKDSSTYSISQDCHLTENSASLKDASFFGNDSDEGYYIQTVVSKEPPQLDKQINKVKINDFFNNIPVSNWYSNGEEGDYVNDPSNSHITIKLEHLIKATAGESHYDFNGVTGFVPLTSPSNITYYWVTKSGKGGFSISDWDHVDEEFDLKNDVNYNYKFSKLQTTGELRILTLAVLREGGAYSRMFSDSSSTSYLYTKDKGLASSKSKTFLQLHTTTSPNFCCVQFDTQGNDTVGTLTDVVNSLSRFTWNSTQTGTFEKKTLYNYTIEKVTPTENLNSLYTLWHKVKYEDDARNKVYSWIYNGSNTSELKCDQYCVWDTSSSVQEINLTTETTPKKLKSTVTWENDNCDTKIAALIGNEGIWTKKYESVKQTVDNNTTNYADYLEKTGSVKKDGIYYNDNGNDNAKNIAKYLTYDQKKHVVLDINNYPSTYKANFYFGGTDSAHIRRTIGQIPAFIEHLPSDS